MFVPVTWGLYMLNSLSPMVTDIYPYMVKECGSIRMGSFLSMSISCLSLDPPSYCSNSNLYFLPKSQLKSSSTSNCCVHSLLIIFGSTDSHQIPVLFLTFSSNPADSELLLNSTSDFDA